MEARLPLKAVIFDAYGTLFREDHKVFLDVFQRIIDLQSLPLEAQQFHDEWQAWEQQFRDQRVALTDDEAPVFQTYMEAWTRCFDQVNGAHQVSADGAQAARLMAETLASQPPYPETVEVLEALARRVQLGILSNADHFYFWKTLNRSGVKVGVVVTSEGEGLYKPHPHIFWRALEEMKCRPQEALYVGNSPEEDVRGAALVGIPAVWINRYGHPWPLADVRPDYEVQDLRTLLDIVDERAPLE